MKRLFFSIMLLLVLAGCSLSDVGDVLDNEAHVGLALECARCHLGTAPYPMYNPDGSRTLMDRPALESNKKAKRVLGLF